MTLKNIVNSQSWRKKHLLPRLHNIGKNRVIFKNPKEERIYKRCKDDIQEKFVTQEKLVEVMVPCFCSLYSESFTTTMITSDSYVKYIEVKLYLFIYYAYT